MEMLDISTLSIAWLWIINFSLLAACIGSVLLLTFKMNELFYYQYMFLSLFGHILGGVIAFEVLFTVGGADGVRYFNWATPMWHGYGTAFMCNIMWYLRSWFFGGNIYAAFSLFICAGFLGSIFYQIFFHELVLLIKERYQLVFDQKKIKWYYFLIVCWPSVFFWTSDPGKDSLCFFSISLFFLSLLQLTRGKWKALFSIVPAAVLAFMIRPYLLLIGVGGSLIWLIFSRKEQANIFLNILLFLLVTTIFIFLAHTVSAFGEFHTYSVQSVASRAMVMRENLAGGGSSIPMPPHGPLALLVLLPYTMFANLFLPLFFWIKNAFGVVASFQNLLLIYLCYCFIKKRYFWKMIKKTHIIGYIFWFFLAGIGFMGITNVNLGLADREKLMYLPLFLICMFLTLSIKGFRHAEQ